MATEQCLIDPKPPPDFEIPHSVSSVEVRIIDTGPLLHIDPNLFWTSSQPDLPSIHAPIYCFLITHRKLNKHILFDLGVRANWRTYAPKIVSLIAATTTVTQGPDIATVLNTNTSGLGILSTDISSIIWSHNHFDHTGDPSTFPPSTELVVGPGVKAASWPGYPTIQDGAVLDSDAAGRNIRDICFHGEQTLMIGNFRAFDFFGDGSFYLLDAPGHAVGHLCGLARTTVEPASFVFMGADACHHAGILRPTEYLPLPREFPLSGLSSGSRASEQHRVACCPGDLLQQLTIGQRPNTPFFEVANTIVFSDHEAALDTVRKIQELDAREDVFTVIAHDLSLRDRMPLFPECVNSWRVDNLASSTRWLFCRDFQHILANKVAEKPQPERHTRLVGHNHRVGADLVAESQ